MKSRLSRLALFLVVAFTAYLLFWLTPALVYRVRRPNIRRECAALSIGMSRDEVIARFRRGAPPATENITGSGLSFGSESCLVDFDPNTQRLTRAHMFEGTIGFHE